MWGCCFEGFCFFLVLNTLCRVSQLQLSWELLKKLRNLSEISCCLSHLPLNLKGSSHLFKWYIAVSDTHLGINFAPLACPRVPWESYSLSYQFLKDGILSWGGKISCVVLSRPAGVQGDFKTVMLHLKADGDRNVTTTYLLGHVSLDLLLFFTFVLGVLKECRFTYVCWPVRTYALDRAFSSSNSFLMQFYWPFPREVFTYVYFNISNFCKLKKILYIVCNILSNCISVKAFFAYSP